MILDWAVLAVSFFITICLFWLALMVLLNGNRRVGGTWLTGMGLLLAGLFFLSHTAILGRGLSETGYGMDFWWWVSWTPAVVAPLCWYGAMLWYTGFRFDGKPHPHYFWLVVVSALAGLVLVLLIFANPLPRFDYVAGRVIAATPSIGGVPLLILAYILFSLACFLLPVDLLLRMDLTRNPLSAAAKRLARPWLAAATLALLVAGGVLAWTALWALTTTPISLSDPQVARTVKQFDLAVAGLVGLAITLLGRTIVAYEPLPRLGFFRHWRSTVLLAGGFSAVTAWTLVIELLPVYSLMLAVVLMAVFYALFSWRAFRERDTFMTQLRPFLASQDLYGTLIGPQAAAGENQRVICERFFERLCHAVLVVRSARLEPLGALATLAGPPLRVGDLGDGGVWSIDQIRDRLRDGKPVPLAQAGRTIWAVPLSNERELAGVLYLGEKIDGNPFSDEEMELAQAGGERLLDMLAGVEIARVAMNLMRQRMSQARVAEGRARRELHDEILPLLHASILELSAGGDTALAVEQLSQAHRKISSLVRDIPSPLPERLAQVGFLAALQGMVEREYPDIFKEVRWSLPDDPNRIEQVCQQMDPTALEVVFYAVRELLRNAARYAGGKQGPSLVTLRISVESGEGLTVSVEDDGCGFMADPQTGSRGNGLRLHGAMLAAVGGTLEIHEKADGGVSGIIRFKPVPV
jgi:signal transduction histidine kinase